jgi:hypothetical protein
MSATYKALKIYNLITLTTCFFKFHFNTILPFMSMSSKPRVLLRFSNYYCVRIYQAARIATAYRLDDREVCSSPGRVKIFLFSTSSRTGSGGHPASYRHIPGALSAGVNRPGHDADHSLMPRSRKCGSIHSLPNTSSWCSA